LRNKGVFIRSSFMRYKIQGTSVWLYFFAGGIYAGFSVQLYRPFLESFDAEEYIFALYPVFAALGCFVLSRRWIRSFWSSVFSGGIYGFGPYFLSLAQYHPTAGMLSSSIPWLFLPAAFLTRVRFRWIGAVLTVVPFAAIPICFRLASKYRLFPVTIQARLEVSDLTGILAPLVMAKRGIGEVNLIGFYHVPIAALVMGFLMLLAGRRIKILLILLVGTIPAFCKSFLEVSPVIWLTIPALCCSVILGVGLEGLSRAASSDRKWLLWVTGMMAGLSIVSLVLASKCFQVFAGLAAGYGRLFVQTAYMYILGAIAVLIIFFMARAKLRMGRLRLIILCTAMGLDIYRGAIFIVGRIF